MTACTACGTENRDKARYCRGCARPLVALGAAHGGAATLGGGGPTAATGHHPPGAHPPQGLMADAGVPAPAVPVQPPAGAAARRRWWPAVAASVALALGAAWWVKLPGQPPPSDAALQAPSPTDAVPGAGQGAALMPVSVTRPADALSSTAALRSPSADAAESAARAATPTLPATPEAPAVAEPAPRPPAASERPADAARARADAARSKPRPAQAAPGPMAAPIDDPAPSPSVAAVTAPVAVAPPVRAPSVDDSCADRSNFITRDLCRIQACGNPAMANDPVCVRFRAMEEANRNRVAQ